MHFYCEFVIIILYSIIMRIKVQDQIHSLRETSINTNFYKNMIFGIKFKFQQSVAFHKMDRYGQQHQYSMMRVIFVNNLSLNLLKINNHFMQKHASPLSSPIKSFHSDSSLQEQLFITNLDSGIKQKANASSINTVILDKQAKIWKGYWDQYSKMDDKLLKLIFQKNIKQIKEILKQFPIDLSSYLYMDGWSLLHYAVAQSQLPIIELLLQHQINPDIQSTTMKRTALHEAVLSNKLDIVSVLIKQGADPNLVDIDRNSALHFAIQYGYDQIVYQILTSEKQINLKLKNNMNMTPVDCCRNVKIVKMLEQYSSSSKLTQKTKDLSQNDSQNQQTQYQSRIIKKNNEILLRNSHADQVQRFLSMRDFAEQHQKKMNSYNGSLVEDQSFVQSGIGEESIIGGSQRKKSKKLVGSIFKEEKWAKADRIAKQSVGLFKQSIFQSYLQNQQKVQNYDKLRKLGQGSFAEVFLIRKKQSSKLLAMKKINKELLIKQNLSKYIYAQKFVLTQINSPFIVKGLNFLQDFTHLYLIMEFCEGGDMEKIVRKQLLSQDIVRNYACEVAIAIDALHSKNILYRDLKVSNVLLDRGGHIKLADFGLVKQASVSYSFLGSVSYLAPEMLVESAQKQHGRSLDWYLVGVFIYELLVGLPPFYNKNRSIMEQSIKNQQFTPLEYISQGCNDALRQLLMKNPKERIDSFQKFKKLKWVEDIDWNDVLNKKLTVLPMGQIDEKELRRKMNSQEETNTEIQTNIQWFKEWNQSKF